MIKWTAPGEERASLVLRPELLSIDISVHQQNTLRPQWVDKISSNAENIYLRFCRNVYNANNTNGVVVR